MSSALATTIALVLYAAVLLPLAVAVWKPRAGRWVAAFYGIALLATGAFNTGWVPLRTLAPVSDVEMAMPTDADRCNQVLGLLEQSRVIIDRSRPDRLVVDQRGWEQLPPPVRDVIVACAERDRPAASGSDPMNVVTQ
jgi:hypothetical protein